MRGNMLQIHLFDFNLVVDILKGGRSDWTLSLLCSVTWLYSVCVFRNSETMKPLRSVLWKELCDGHQRETQIHIQLHSHYVN